MLLPNTLSLNEYKLFDNELLIFLMFAGWFDSVFLFEFKNKFPTCLVNDMNEFSDKKRPVIFEVEFKLSKSVAFSSTKNSIF